MPKTVVVDLSHHNTVPESLKPAKAAGVLGVIHKLTEGTGYVDDKVAARYHLALDADLLWGVYHFIRPGKIAEQARHFLAQAKGVANPETIFVLDYEDAGVSLDDCLQFLELVEVETGRTPIIYSGHVLKEKLGGKPNANLARYPLWLAQYGPEAVLPPGWDNYWLWQFTDKGTVPGINPPTDCNAYDGPTEQMVAEWRGEEAPEPAPEPEAGEVSVVIAAPAGIIVNVVVNGERR